MASKARVIRPDDLAVYLRNPQIRSRIMVDQQVGSKNVLMLYNEMQCPYEGVFHTRAGEEILFMISGESVCEMEGGERLTLTEHSVLFVPPGVKHRHFFPNPGMVRTLGILAPPGDMAKEAKSYPVEGK